MSKILEDMKKIQESILGFLGNEEDTEENFLTLSNILTDCKIFGDHHKIRSILHLISKIANNYYHVPNFYSKIERIIELFKDDISKFLTNSEKFNIFKGNKRIILFLIKQKIIIIDKYIINKITQPKYFNEKYPQYFWPEIEPFINNDDGILSFQNNKENDEKNKKSIKYFDSYRDFYSSDEEFYDQCAWIDELKDDFPENFEEKRIIGENESQICELIRKDSIKEFIVYVNKNNYPLESNIEPSIFETNRFLMSKKKKQQL